MKEYNMLGLITENEQKYVVLLDEKLNKYFLKMGTEGNFEYPTIEEMNSLIKKYFYFKPTVFNNFEFGKKITLEAKVWCGKKLIPLSIITMLAFSALGCKTNESLVKEYATNGIVLEQTNENYGIYKLKSVDISKIQENNDLNITANNFANFSYSQKCSPEEFSKYTGESNVTWENIYKLIETLNVDIKIKEIIKKGTKNIENSGLDINLSVFSYNLKRMTFRYVDETELPTLSAGAFNRLTGEVLLSKESSDDVSKTEHIILHEVLGHGMTSAYMPDYGGIDCNIDFDYFQISGGQFQGGGQYGKFLTESVADMIAVTASGKKIQDENGGYATEVFSTNFIANLLDIDLSELASYGIKGLENQMQNSKVDDPTVIISYLDYLFNFVHNSTGGQLDKELNSQILKDFFKEWCQDRSKDGWTYDDMLARVKKAIDYSKYNEGTVYNNNKYICSGAGNGNLIDVTALESEIMKELEKYDKSKTK